MPRHAHDRGFRTAGCRHHDRAASRDPEPIPQAEPPGTLFALSRDFAAKPRRVRRKTGSVMRAGHGASKRDTVTLASAREQAFVPSPVRLPQWTRRESTTAAGIECRTAEVSGRALPRSPCSRRSSHAGVWLGVEETLASRNLRERRRVTLSAPCPVPVSREPEPARLSREVGGGGRPAARCHRQPRRAGRGQGRPARGGGGRPGRSAISGPVGRPAGAAKV
jgi:hypothetical protein